MTEHFHQPSSASPGYERMGMDRGDLRMEERYILSRRLKMHDDYSRRAGAYKRNMSAYFDGYKMAHTA
jgi:hypothetical protein